VQPGGATATSTPHEREQLMASFHLNHSPRKVLGERNDIHDSTASPRSPTKSSFIGSFASKEVDAKKADISKEAIDRVYAKDETFEFSPYHTLSLQLEIDMTKSPEGTHTLSQSVHDAAADAVTANGDAPANHLRVIRSDVAGPIDFNGAHQLPPPSIVKEYPLVVEIVYPKNSSTCFVRGFLSLTHCDGVRLLHIMLQVVEFLEGRAAGAETPVVSAYPHTAKNDAPSLSPFRRIPLLMMQMQLGMMFFGLLGSLLIKLGLISKDADGAEEPVFGPAAEKQEARLAKRQVRCYVVPEQIGYKGIFVLAEQIKRLCGYYFYFFTVNFSPRVAMALTKDLGATKSPASRANSMFTPVMAAPPMLPAVGAGFALGLFWNNYGKHSPNIRADVKRFLWDWRGIPKLVSWALLMVTIQGKTFLVSHAPGSKWKRHHTALAALGEGLPVEPAPHVA